MKKRVLAVGLDGFELSIAKEMVSAGKLPYFKKLFSSSAFFQLDHGTARNTGLAWEHFSTGQHPDDYKRWSPMGFNPKTYGIIQNATSQRPFTSKLSSKVVAFDVPYHQIADSDNLLGMIGWGAHDPGVASHSNPAGLKEEIEQKFGKYPAQEYIYGFVWPSASRTRDMADQLAAAMQKRSEIADWLLTERLPDWELAIVVTSEMHSGIEALWHGWDASHPLHHHPSAQPAREGLERIYTESDRMLSRLESKLADTTIVVFAMHGMGSNDADVPSMALLPEFLYRLEYNKPHLHSHASWLKTEGCELDPNADWSVVVNARLGTDPPEKWFGLARQLQKRSDRKQAILESTLREGDLALDWIPSARYASFWPEMRAFAFPSFYDGQIRLNLIGRESQGRVELANYSTTLDELEKQLSELRNYRTGEPAVASFSRPVQDDPQNADATQCDLKINWGESAIGWTHPTTGTIGPIPHRRPGGHTGEFGFAAILDSPLPNGDYGIRSSMDVVPTIIELLGTSPDKLNLSGSSLLDVTRAKKERCSHEVLSMR